MLTIALLPLSAQNVSPRLNVIYIMTDDHSFQTISAYDKRYINTPNIDRIANEGMLFQKAYVTNSISGPSRAVLLTGKFGHLNGVRTNSDAFDGSQQTFPKLLQEAGYQTAIVGKWHLISDPTGFDYWNILPGQGDYYNPDFIEMGERRKHEGYATDITTDLALDWMSNIRDKSRPFCLLLHHKAPHRTWMPDLKHLGMFDDRDFPLPDNFFDDYKGRDGAAHQKMSIAKDMNVIYDLKMADKEGEIITDQPGLDRAGRNVLNTLTPQQRAIWDAYYDPIINDYKAENRSGDELANWKFQRYMKDYLSCIQSVDENIGRLFDYLEENGLLENTVIIYTSDQGFYMGEHGWFDKRFMYEESFRTPLMIRMPRGMGRTGKTSLLVQNIDNAPTILDLAGVDIPEDIQGISLVPVLKKKRVRNWRKMLYYHFYESTDDHAVSKHYGVRTKRYKLVHFYDPIDTWEMYDLKKDPAEMKNVYADPSYKRVLSKMQKNLEYIKKYYNDAATQILVEYIYESQPVDLTIIQKEASRFAVGPSAFSLEGHFVWGGSMIRETDGKYYLIYSAPESGVHPFGNAWVLGSKMGIAVSDRPDGDFKHLKFFYNTGGFTPDTSSWDAQTVMNPHIRRFNDKYYLYYVGSSDPGNKNIKSPTGTLDLRSRIQQMLRIGVMEFESFEKLLAGDFIVHDKPLLEPRTRVKPDHIVDPSPEGTKPMPDNIIVVNPSVVFRPSDNKYLLYFKGNFYDPTWRGVHGVAIGDSPTGPFIPLDIPVFDLEVDDGEKLSAEDPYVWHNRKQDMFYAVFKDFTGCFTKGVPSLAIMYSKDGIHWELPEHSMFIKRELLLKTGETIQVNRLERPQLLLDENDDPIVLFAACAIDELDSKKDGSSFNVQIGLKKKAVEK
jgi:arylsulfatase A-like enzyme